MGAWLAVAVLVIVAALALAAAALTFARARHGVTAGHAAVIGRIGDRVEVVIGPARAMVVPFVTHVEHVDLSPRTLEISLRRGDAVRFVDGELELTARLRLSIEHGPDEILCAVRALGCAGASDDVTLRAAIAPHLIDAVDTVAASERLAAVEQDLPGFAARVLAQLGRDTFGLRFEALELDTRRELAAHREGPFR